MKPIIIPYFYRKEQLIKHMPNMANIENRYPISTPKKNSMRDP